MIKNTEFKAACQTEKAFITISKPNQYPIKKVIHEKTFSIGERTQVKRHFVRDENDNVIRCFDRFTTIKTWHDNSTLQHEEVSYRDEPVKYPVV